ncbi:DUF1016 N-terminal domain-containing protein, partial [Paraflavisolibacter sp. H34]|uniref:DUF1016 N-terminal domain-containing protein n=1 Tax=Huijunlia imazamoxiresistens TaxID=3127457 RepID=UPI003016BC53
MQLQDSSYKKWLSEIKQRIRSAQIKAALKVNAELIGLYWELGKEILEKEKAAEWGDKLIPQLAKDLITEFPEIKGFSKRNLFYVRQFVAFYTADQQIVQQLVAQFADPKLLDHNGFVSQSVEQNSQDAVRQIPEFLARIPWGHHLQIITKCKGVEEALFYVSKTAEHGWSRNVLVHQVESDLYRRQGKAVTNFGQTLPAPQSDLARELLKDPYKFD